MKTLLLKEPRQTVFILQKVTCEDESLLSSLVLICLWCLHLPQTQTRNQCGLLTSRHFSIFNVMVLSQSYIV